MSKSRASSKVSWEPLSILLDDGLPELVRQHHAEVGVFKREMPLDVDWDGYYQDERNGILRVLGARIDEKLVGYSSFCIFKGHRHYRSTPHALNDGIFVLKRHRHTGIGVELIDKGERDILADFAPRFVRFRYHDKTFVNLIGPVLKKRGYEHNEDGWDKMTRAA
jgi:GNAT superfamily N-acetyltransferase